MIRTINRCRLFFGAMLFVVGLGFLQNSTAKNNFLVDEYESIVYSLAPVIDILSHISSLNNNGAVASDQIDRILCETAQGGEQKYHTDIIRLVLQQAMDILEKFHAQVEIAQLLDWYGQLVAFSLEFGIQDRAYIARAPREAGQIDQRETASSSFPSSPGFQELMVNERLMVKGDIETTGDVKIGHHLELNAPEGDMAYIVFKQNGTGEKARIFSNPSNGVKDICMSIDGGQTVSFRIDDQGGVNCAEGSLFIDQLTRNIGVGIVTPQVLFDIGGDAQVAGNFSILGDFIPENIDVISNATVNGTSTLVGKVGIGNAGVGDAILSVDGGLHVGGTSDPGDNNLIVDGDISVAGCLEVTGTTILHDVVLDGGHTQARGTFYYDAGVPGIHKNMLRVTKGVLSDPYEFHSINDALASIADNSADNPYVIKVGPGVFVEDTIIMKPFVSLVGDTPYTSIIEVDATSKDVLVAAPNSALRFVQLRGATDLGKAAIVYHGGGWSRVTDCIFGANDIILLQDATEPYISSLLLGSSEVVSDSNFTYLVKATANGPIPVFIKIDDMAWIAFSNPNLDAVIDLSGPYCYMVANDVTFGAFTTLGTGTGIRLTNLANVSLNASVLSGFNTAVDIPNIGAGPSIIFSSVYARNNVIDLNVQNPLTTGIISCVFARDKTIITDMAEGTTGLRLFFSDSISGTMTVGPQFVGNKINEVTNVNPQIQQASSLGIINGGDFAPTTGLNIKIEAGSGYLMVGVQPDDYLKYVIWDQQEVTLTSHQDNFISIDKDGCARVTQAEPPCITAILIGKVRASDSGPVYCQHVQKKAIHAATQLDEAWRKALGNIFVSGSLGSKNGDLQLDVSSGRYFYGMHEYTPAGGTAIAWVACNRDGANNFILAHQDTIDFDHYDDGSGSLAVVPENKFAKHALYLVDDGDSEKYIVVYGQETFDSLLAAQNGGLPPKPGSWTGNIVAIASIVVKNSAITIERITEIRDERPRIGFQASGITSVSRHGDLTDLLQDDHPQYFLVAGGRSMTGTLNMGGNNITGLGEIDGVDVSLHAARHRPNGADPLPTAMPETIGTVNAEGLQNSFARSDHIHAHGDQAGGALHALVTTGAHGFMSLLDKAKLDLLEKTDYVHRAGDSMTGTLAISTGAGNALEVATDKFMIESATGNTSIDGNLTLNGTAQLTALTTGIVHASADGIFSSTLLVDVDIDPAAEIADSKLATISSAGKVTNSATTAVSANTADAIVTRDGAGNFVAGTITADLSGTATNFAGALVGDVTGTQDGTVVFTVGGEAAADIATASVLANAATSVNTVNQLVQRDVNGNFAAGLISANLAGNANTATTATIAQSFSGVLSGDVIGNQVSTSVVSVGGALAADIAQATVCANDATALNVTDTIVRRNSVGDFAAGVITASLFGNATTATTATNLSGALVGDVTGTQSATVVSLVGGEVAADVATGVVLANAATQNNIASQIVRRDASGDFTAGTIAANLSGNATTATTATNLSGPLVGDVTGTQAASVVALVGSETAANVATGSVLANAATASNTANQIVKRDGSGNFTAGTMTGSLSGAASANMLKAGDTMTGPLMLSGVSSNLTVEGTTQLETLHALGRVDFDGIVGFTQGVPGLPGNTRVVTKGSLHGPNQFASVNAALASITDHSANNPYVIKVGPGVFVEDTIVMKPFVSLVGDTPYTSIIEVDDTSKDVLVAAPNSALRFVQLRGATDSGKAAIVYHGGGWSRVTDCIFGKSDIILLQDGAEPNISSLLLGSSEVLSDSNFTYLVKSTATGPIPVFIKLDDLTWIAFSNPNLDAVIDLSGIYCYMVINDVTFGAFTTLDTGTGMRLTDRANVSMNASVLSGFDTAVDLPNIGAGPSIIFSSVYARNNVIDLNVQNPLTTGIISCVFARDKTIITEMADTTEGLRLFFSDSISGTMTVGPQFVGNKIDQVTNINPQIQQGSALGVIAGGDLSEPGDLDVAVAAGIGYLMVGTQPHDWLKLVEWDAQTIALPANQDNYLYIDDAGILKSSLSVPDFIKTILVGKTRTTSSGVLYCQNVQKEADHASTRLDESWRKALGCVYASGSVVSKNGTIQLDVSPGQYYLGTHQYTPTGGTAIDWQAFYRDGSSNFTITQQSSVDFDHYDLGTGTLVASPIDEYVRHALYIVDDGLCEKYLAVYGQETYATLSAAQTGTIASAPASWSGNIALIASVIVKNSVVEAERIAEIRDERPRLGFKASGISLVTDHGDLTGLLNDNHPQYLLASGVRAMTGTLNMGGHNIVGLGLVDGVDVSLHATRHLPNGADPLPTATPVTIGSSNSEGIQNSFARSDHVHAHGTQDGGALHAVATGSAAGFMSPTDKTKLDTLDSSDFVTTSGGTITGALHINVAGANALQVATDQFVVNGTNGNTAIAGSLTIGDTVTLSDLASGVVHANGSGLLTSSFIVNNDISASAAIADSKLAQIGAAGKVANSATTATSSNGANSIVARDGSGSFAAGIITADLAGTATSFSGALAGDVTGTQGTTVVVKVGGKTAASISSAVTLASDATANNSGNKIIKRDASGNFSAGTITATLNGNATYAISAGSATDFTGTFAGEVTGTQGSTVVASVGGKTAAAVAAGTTLANNATSTSSPNTIVKRDASNNFSAGTITANLHGNATTADSTTNFNGELLGDVTGMQGATVVSAVGGQTALEVASATTLANNATDDNSRNTLVKRDGSGNFSAGTITADLTGAASENVAKSGDTMTGPLYMGSGAAKEPSFSFSDDTGAGMFLPGKNSLAFATNGVTRLTIDSSGAVLSKCQYKMSAYLRSNSKVNGNNAVRVPFDTEVFDSGGDYNASSDKYTAPVNGFYWVATQVGVIARASTIQNKIIRIMRNNDPVPACQNETLVLGYWGSHVSIPVTGLVYLDAGDHLWVEYEGGKDDYIMGNYTHLHIHFMSL